MADQRQDMNNPTRASALVAPLNIVKGEKHGDDSKKPKEDQTHQLISATQTRVVTPPLTPEQAAEYPQVRQSEDGAIFHNFLRAFYNFHPASTVSSSAEEESSITVPINVGDVILVHSVHPNGWADGTLLASGARGWIPTNYCEAYSHEYIRNLLSALTRVWDILRASEFEDDLKLFSKQDYVRSMIAAVRYFLQCTRCLNRDAGVVQGHVGIRRLRKGLLSDLSSFVKSTKRLQEIVETQPSTEELQNQLDELVLKAFKVVTRAVRFLDVWLQDVAAQDVGAAAAGEQGRARPLQPPTESAVEENANHEAAQSRPQEIDFAAGQNSSILLPERAHSVSSGGTGVAQSAPNPHPAHELGQATVQDPSQPSDAVPAIQLVPPRSASVSHRLSYSMRSGIPAQKNSLASEKLSAAQDAFLGYIGSFIGLHLQSRSSSELLVITQQSVAACRQLLVVVDEVWERDARRSETLEQARNNMQDRLGDLVQATQDLFTPSEAEGSDHVLMPDQGKHLVAAATSCVRSAGDCVGKTRQVIEKIGDFEFEAVGLGLSESIFNRLPSLAASYYTEQPNTQTNTEDTASEISQSSSSRPAPPPLYQSVSKPLPKTPLASPPIEKSLPPITQTTASVPDSLENGPPLRPPLTIDPPTYSSDTRSQSPESATKPVFDKEGRAESIGVSVSSSSNDTDPYSYRDSETSGLSTISTRATTPDQSPSSHKDSEKQLLSSFGSLSDIQSSILEEPYDAESQVLEKTYAHELIYNKEGQVAGGSLPALIEKLTTHDSTPDAMFVTTFYLTFRLFTTPVEFSQLLINRFEYVSESRHMARPVQLRVYNVFKGWLESHWQGDTDSEALPMILPFATGRLRAALPAAGRRLAELTAKVSEVHAGALVPRLISSVGKTNTSIGLYTDKDTQLPNPIITKSQLNALRNAKNGGNPCSILDFDPLELARQFTIIESRIFCAIQSEELLGLEWTNKNHSKAVNVRAMSKLSTDLANLVADTILSVDDAKKRAIVIKQWVKIGMKCLELNNYDSLMAIICSLNSSMVLRLKRTWELVSVKTRNRLEELRAVVDCSKNYAVLRQRLENEIAPCLPFVGIYLTDLTFVDVGNQTTRQLPGSRNGEGAAVINFDKHMKTAKIIGQLQRFQIPYKLVAVPEMQDWMESQIRRVRSSEETNVQQFYRRSLYLEPRETRPASKPSPSEHNEGTFPDNGRSNSKDHGREKFDFSRAFTFSSSQKEKLAS